MEFIHLMVLFYLISEVISNAGPVLMSEIRRERDFEGKDNLKALLDFVHKCPEFESSDFVVASGTRRFEEWISDYLSDKSTPVYRVEMRREHRMKSFRNKSRLTWIILTENIDVVRYGGVDLWKTINKYVVIFVGNCSQEVNRIFGFLWYRYSISGVMVASSCDGFGSFLKYSPFKKSSPSSYGVVERVGMKNVLQSTSGKIFENFHNLNGHPLKVCAFSSAMFTVTRSENGEVILSGAEAEMVHSIRSELNATFQFDDIECTSNATDPFNAALSSLTNGFSDLILTGYFEKLYDWPQSSYEFTASGYQDKLCLIVPTGGPIPKFMTPLLPFNTYFWPIIVVYIIAARVLQICARCASLAATGQRRFRSRRTGPKTPIDHLNSCVQFCFPSQGPKALSERILVISILLTSVVFLGCYQSGLTTVLNMPHPQKPQLNTLTEVADSHFLIYSKFENLLDSIFNDGSPVTRKLKRKIRVLKSSESSAIDIVAHYKNITTIERISGLYVGNFTKYIDEDGEFVIHIVPEYPARYMVAYVVPHASPLLKRLNMVILRLEEAGLHNKWIFDERYKTHLNSVKYFPKTKRGTVLTLANFTLSFIGLFVGLFGSLLIFISEKYYHKKIKGN